MQKPLVIRSRIMLLSLFLTMMWNVHSMHYVNINTRGVANIRIYEYPRKIGQISRIIFVSANSIFIRIFVLSADTNIRINMNIHINIRTNIRIKIRILRGYEYFANNSQKFTKIRKISRIIRKVFVSAKYSFVSAKYSYSYLRI